MSRIYPTAMRLRLDLDAGDETARARVRRALEAHRTAECAASELGVALRTLTRWLTRWPELRPAGWGPRGRPVTKLGQDGAKSVTSKSV